MFEQFDKIKIWKKNYNDIDIFIRNLGTIWEYLFCWKNQIYTAHIVVKPGWKKFFSREKYNEKTIEEIIRVVFIMAKTTVDEILKKTNGKDTK